MYPTSKVQCRIAITKDVLWVIVNKTEVDPGRDHAEAHSKFTVQRELLFNRFSRHYFTILVSLTILLLCGESSGNIFKRKHGQTD